MKLTHKEHLKFVSVDQEFEEPLRRFLFEHFPHEGVQNDAEWFAWHAANPEESWQLCLDGETIAAVQRWLPVQLRAGGATVQGAFSNDTMVDRDYRRQGIGSRFHERRVESFGVALSSGQSLANAKTYESLGFKTLGMYFRFKVVPVFPRFYAKRHYIREVLGWATWKARGRPDRSVRVTSSKKPPEAIEQSLLENRFAGQAAFPVPGFDHWLWRYAAHPFYSYDFHTIHRDSETIAVAVTRAEGERCYLLDVLADQTNLSIAIGALAAGVPSRSIEGIAIGEALHESFRKAGWYTFTYGCEDVLLGKASKLLDLESLDWCMFMGESDKEA